MFENITLRYHNSRMISKVTEVLDILGVGEDLVNPGTLFDIQKFVMFWQYGAYGDDPMDALDIAVNLGLLELCDEYEIPRIRKLRS